MLVGKAGRPALRNPWIENSALVAERRAVEASFEGRPFHRPTREQIARLEAQGCSSRDWESVRFAEGFRFDSVRGVRFIGEVVLGRFDPARDPQRPEGIYDSTLRDCRVGDGARVSRCADVERLLVGPGAVLEGVQRAGASGDHSVFGNDLVLFENELFSRRLRAVAELPFDWAAALTGPDAAEECPDPEQRTRAFDAAADAYAERMRSDRGFVGPGARVVATAVVENAWLGGGTVVDGAQAVRDSTLWATPDEPTRIADGAVVSGALIGPGCVLTNHCVVERSILFEHVSVGQHASVKRSAVGANSRLASGEANDSLLGPFTTSIHQGAILAAWWPDGRGNVAYGANVGSNHTGRAPDQEIWPGEGLFFGLGADVKFPGNYRDAPYTIVATGVVCLPQRVSFPFSLVQAPTRSYPGVSPAINEIRPAWGLTNNAYGIERQERRQRDQNRSRRSDCAPEILRRDVVDDFRRAVELLDIPDSERAEFYLEARIPGLGKNVLTEAARRDAVEGYAFGMRAGAARLLLRSLAATLEGETPEERVALAEPVLIRWADEILAGDGDEAPLDATETVERAIAAFADWAARARAAKARDDARGCAILDDYAVRHLAAEADPHVRALDAELARHRADATAYVETIEAAVAPGE